jgi:peptidyl-prolyl cis-trans isomerase C
MKIRILVAAALAAPLLAGAQQPAKKDPAPKKGAPAAIATVNGVPVPRARAEALLNQQRARGAPDNEQIRGQIREELVNREVLMQEATRAGVARSPEVAGQLDLARQEIVISAFLRDYVRKHPVSDADVQKEYDRVKAAQGDKEYRARHILVETEDQAKDVIAQLKKGAKFDELATKLSKDPGSAQRGGDLDWSVPAAYDKQFADALVKLDKGKYTESPVQTRFGYHVIQLDDVRQTRFPSLAEVKPRIQQQLTQHKVDELVRELRAKAKVTE